MNNYEYTDVAIVGGGIVGLSTAYKLSLMKPDLKITIIEKEKKLASHQTSRNSGVIHSGIYYKPGSYKARNCVTGRRELVAFAKEHHIPHEICGKIIVATDSTELAHLERVYNNGVANGVENIEMIGPDKIKEIEPYCVGIKAIYVGCTGIIFFGDVAEKLGQILIGRGGEILLDTEVIGFSKDGDFYNIHTSNQKKIKAKYLITTAGLQADRLARKEGHPSEAAIVGFRGDYYDLTDKGMHKVRNLIYPVPNPKFPFLGVHFTRMIKGGVECGPNAVFVFHREGYSKAAFNLKDTIDAFTFKGTWKFFFKHWKFGLDEYRGAFSKKFFLKRLQKLIPSLEMDDIVASRCGIRAMALSPEGEMLDDFKIEGQGNVLHVINSPSPAATACLAYGGEIARMAIEQFKL